jgi:GntR family transcriptional regulator
VFATNETIIVCAPRAGSSSDERDLTLKGYGQMATNNLRVNPFDSVPKYHQLYAILRQQIEEGYWQPHESIPSERELEKLYDVSRTTVRQALNLLVVKNLLYRSHGKGTFVARPKLKYSLQLLSSFSDELRMRGLEPGQKLLNLGRIEPSAHVREQLALPPAVRDVLKIERLRLANGEPIGIHSALLPLTPEQEITAAELEEWGSLYTLLENKFNLIVAEADQTIEATIADERESSLLQVPVGSPLLQVERTTWSHLHTPMELVRMLYRADHYKFEIHMSHERY